MEPVDTFWLLAGPPNLGHTEFRVSNSKIDGIDEVWWICEAPHTIFFCLADTFLTAGGKPFYMTPDDARDDIIRILDLMFA